MGTSWYMKDKIPRFLRRWGLFSPRPVGQTTVGEDKWLKTICVGVLVSTVFPGASATSIYALGFNELVEKSGAVVIGTVIDLQTHATGQTVPQSEPKQHRSPNRPPEQSIQDDPQSEEDTLTAGGAATVAPPASPVAVGVEGGRMLFTRVEFLIENVVAGEAGSQSITFDVAGGSDGQVEVTVFGMPKFELNKKYLVFLNPDYPNSKTPVVGVNQGYFEVVTDTENGEEILRNASGDIVVDIEEDSVIVQRGSEQTGHPIHQLGLAPVPDNPGEVEVSVSPEVSRYWLRTENAMSITDFVSAVHSAKESAL